MLLTLKLYAMEWVQKQFNILVLRWKLAWFLSKIVHPLEICFLLFMLLTPKLYAMEWVQRQFNILVLCWIIFFVAAEPYSSTVH